MGAAVDSFILVVGLAGIIALAFLIYSLFTRIKKGPGNRGVFQRMPLLLPSLAFIITIIIILQLGIAPIQDFKGYNSNNYYLFDNTEIRFNVYEPGIAYVEVTDLNIHCTLDAGESVHTILDIYRSNDLIDTITVNLVSSENQSIVSEERVLSLEPGNYLIKVGVTFYEQGVVVQSYNMVRMTLTQETIETLNEELVEWSTYQFMINVGSFFFIIGGLCVGKEDKRERRIDDFNKRTATSEEYRSYD